MKYIMNKLSIFLLALIPLLWACGDEEPIYYSDVDFVSFQAQSSNAGENSGVSTLQIARSTTDLSGTLTVNVTIAAEYANTTSFFDEGDDATGTFTAETTELTFADGEALKTIDITGVDDVLSSGDKRITVTINEVSDSRFNIGTPGPDGLFSTHVVTIVDDDCPIDLTTDWVGNYTVTESFTAGANQGLTLAGALGETYAVTLSADESDPTGTGVIWNNIAGNNVFFDEGETMAFVTCAGEVTFGSGDPQIAEFANLTITSTSYDSGTITIVGTLANFGEYTIVLTRN